MPTASRQITTTGLALMLVATGGLVQAYVWLSWLLLVVGLFVFIWGREPRAVESWLASLPAGVWLLKGLKNCASVLFPQDDEHDEFVHAAIADYSREQRIALRTLWRTRSARSISDAHWVTFNNSGLVDHPHSGPGGIKTELRDAVDRALTSVEHDEATNAFAEALRRVDGLTAASRKVTSQEALTSLLSEYNSFIVWLEATMAPHITGPELTSLISRVPPSALSRTGSLGGAHDNVEHNLEEIASRLRKLIERYST